jgi:LCP family protein required for cell wall assembly
MSGVDAWAARTATLDVAGDAVAVLDIAAGARATGPPLLVLHGFPTSSIDFQPAIERLARQRRVVLLDFPGFGLSAKPDRPYSLFGQADVVAVAAAHADLDEVDLLTHDMGDSVGGEVLARSLEGDLPFQVRRRVLTNGSIYLDMAQLTDGQKFLLDLPDAVLPEGSDVDPATLTDTLMVGAFDRHKNEMALINIPRDTGRFPLYNGPGTYNNRINSFLGHARRNPEQYPEGPIRALTNQVAFLVGVPIHYYAVIDMAGFERLIDLVGGVTVTIDYRIADHVRRLEMEPGTHRLDGKLALSFVRSRHGPNNSDYRRAQRQQQVIKAMADRLRDPAVTVRLPVITREAAKMARTNIPVDNLEEFLAVLDDVTDATPMRVVLQPRRYAQRVPPSEVGGRFMTELRMDRVEQLSIELFREFSLYSRRSQEFQPPVNVLLPAAR